MKTLFLIATLSLILVWLLQASETFDAISYTEKAAGIVPVHKIRYEWHFERLTPFLRALPRKATNSLKKTLLRLRRKSVAKGGPPESASPENFHRIRLKNGSEVLGRIVEEKGGLVWIEIEGGKIAFKREEVIATTP